MAISSARGQVTKGLGSKSLTIKLATNGKEYPELVSWATNFNCNSLSTNRAIFDSLPMQHTYQCHLNHDFEYMSCPDLVQADAKTPKFALFSDGKVTYKSTDPKHLYKQASKTCDNTIQFTYNEYNKLFNFKIPFRKHFISLLAVFVSLIILVPLFSKTLQKKLAKLLKSILKRIINRVKQKLKTKPKLKTKRKHSRRRYYSDSEYSEESSDNFKFVALDDDFSDFSNKPKRR